MQNLDWADQGNEQAGLLSVVCSRGDRPGDKGTWLRLFHYYCVLCSSGDEIPKKWR